MPSTRRVVVYTETTSRGGAEVSVRNLLGALSPAWEVVVTGIDAEVCQWLADARPGTDVVLLPPLRTKAELRSFFAHRKRLAELAPAVFHANLRTMSDARWALLSAASVRDLAVLAVEQLPFPPPTTGQRLLKRLTSRLLDAHVAVGDRAARRTEAASGLREGRVRTIRNGVPDVDPDPGPPPGRRMIGTLARLDHIKGLDLLLHAAASLPGVEVVIAGDGPDRAELVQQAARLGIEGRVRFVPWRDDARHLLADLDVFVLPSRNEGFPLSIVEAMLAARPVVATAVGSVEEAVVDGETGIVVPPDEVPALTEALRTLLDDPARAQAMGQVGRARALERFTAEVMATQFEALYDEL